VANAAQEISPQVDILIYDRTTFPHLAVNEDGSVVICCEPLYATVECKTIWDVGRVTDHFDRLKKVEAGRYAEFFGDRDENSGYFVFVVDRLSSPDLSALEDADRFVGAYSLRGAKSWRSPFEESDFAPHEGNALEAFLRDILEDSMRKSLVELGTLRNTYEAVSKYFGWGMPCAEPEVGP